MLISQANRSEARTRSGIEKLIKEMPSLQDKISHFEFKQLDVSDLSSVKEFVSSLARAGRKIDLLGIYLESFI